MDWSQFAAIAGLMIVLFGWLKFDIRDGFARVYERLANVDERLREHGERLARLEQRAGPRGAAP